MKTLIRGGRVLDPSCGRDGLYDLIYEDGRILKVEPHIRDEEALNVIDAEGLWIVPGLIDLHVHFRDPGLTYKETIETGCKAAAAGGFTAVCCMPNTQPVIDCAEVVRYVQKEASRAPYTRLCVIGAITKGQQGTELADIREMAEAGICALSEDGKSVMDPELMRQAMLMARDLDLPIFDHCEDKNLSHGCVNACEAAEKLGLPQLTGIEEEIMTARDIMLAQETGARLHICHVSTGKSARILELAQCEGIDVTGEVCPHHFALDDSKIALEDPNYKMAPPLRSKKDMLSMQQALARNVISCISTDHAPHAPEEKNKGMKDSANGIVGLETSVPISVTTLVKGGVLTPLQLIERMSTAPGRILGQGGTLQAGAPADITMIDTQHAYKIDASRFYSKGRNTPYDGMTVYGKVVETILGGETVFYNGKIIEKESMHD